MTCWQLVPRLYDMLAADATLVRRPIHLRTDHCPDALALQHVLPNLPGGKAALKPWFEYQGMPLRW